MSRLFRILKRRTRCNPKPGGKVPASREAEGGGADVQRLGKGDIRGRKKKQEGGGRKGSNISIRRREKKWLLKKRVEKKKV